MPQFGIPGSTGSTTGSKPRQLPYFSVLESIHCSGFVAAQIPIPKVLAILRRFVQNE